jgi:hypothetical protein
VGRISGYTGVVSSGSGSSDVAEASAVASHSHSGQQLMASLPLQPREAGRLLHDLKEQWVRFRSIGFGLGASESRSRKRKREPRLEWCRNFARLMFLSSGAALIIITTTWDCDAIDRNNLCDS